MELSKGSITGITIAVIAIFIATFGTYIYLRRRRRRQRRAANAPATTTTTTTTNTSATTNSTIPSSHKNNATESHVLQPRKKLPPGLKKHHAQDTYAPDLELGHGFGPTAPTPTVTANRKRYTVPTGSHSVIADTAFPALDIPIPITTTAAGATSSDVAANGETYAMDNRVTSKRSPALGRLTTDFDVDREQQRHFAFSDRPSSLHQAVLEIGGKDEEAEDVGRTSKDGGEIKREDSNHVAKEVSQRPTGYTGAWP